MGDNISQWEVDGFQKKLNSGAIDQIVGAVTDDVAYQDELRGAQSGRDAFARAWGGWLAAFPDMQVLARRTTISGRTAVVEVTATGTNTGALAMPDGSSLPPTNRKISVEAAWVWEFANDGKVKNFRSYGNPSKLLGQLGLAMPGGSPTAATSP